MSQVGLCDRKTVGGYAKITIIIITINIIRIIIIIILLILF